MPLSPAEKQARYRERQRERRETLERERLESTPLALTVADLTGIIQEATDAATRAAIARFSIPGPQEAGRAPVERDGDSGRGRGKDAPVPSPDAPLSTDRPTRTRS